MSLFLFDKEAAKVMIRIRDLKISAKYNTCKLTKSVAEKEIEVLTASNDMEKVLESNADKFFAAAKFLRLDKIFIHPQELVGCANVRYDGWPAIWQLVTLVDGDSWDTSNSIRYRAGCGNRDQAQVMNSDLYLPQHILRKAWDVQTRTEIDIEPFKNMRVCTA
jgi:hypothetical protein